MREISQAVIGRLPRYYRYLGDLQQEGIERVSSRELSHIMGVTASQIRQDFNNFGGFGQQGYGYNVDHLHTEIGRILGVDHEHSMVLIGAGNLGQALVKYMNSRRDRGFYFKAAFDISPKLQGKSIGEDEVPIYAMDNLAGYIDSAGIDIAVLTIPKTAALDIVEVLEGTQIKAIWNFAHLDLKVPERIQVENVHLQDSLMKLTYSIGEYEKRQETEQSTAKKSRRK